LSSKYPWLSQEGCYSIKNQQTRRVKSPPCTVASQQTDRQTDAGVHAAVMVCAAAEESFTEMAEELEVCKGHVSFGGRSPAESQARSGNSRCLVEDEVS